MRNKLYPILVKRAVVSLIVLFMLVTFIFILLRISPGDPAQKFVRPDLDPEIAQNLRESFGLNESIIDQYFSFLVNVASGNFGVSYNFHSPVFSVIMEYLPFTFTFALIVLVVQFSLGYLLARVTFGNVNEKLEKFIGSLGLLFYSLPSFVIALILIYIFSVNLNLFPTSGLRSISFDDLSTSGKFLDYAAHLVLPVLTLSFYGIVVFYKYLRDNFDTVSNRLFIHYLKANGFDKNEIKKHIFKNSLSPVISIIGVEFSVLLGGALITEVIFSLPGMGSLTVNAILMRDYPLITGTVLLSGVLVLLANLLSDIFRVLIDKRVTKEIL